MICGRVNALGCKHNSCSNSWLEYLNTTHCRSHACAGSTRYMYCGKIASSWMRPADRKAWCMRALLRAGCRPMEQGCKQGACHTMIWRPQLLHIWHGSCRMILKAAAAPATTTSRSPHCPCSAPGPASAEGGDDGHAAGVPGARAGAWRPGRPPERP